MRHTDYMQSSERKNKGFLPLIIAEIIGIAAGSFIAFSGIDTENIKRNLCPALNGATLLDIFSNTLIISVLFLVIAFFSGLFAFGQPLGIALLVIKGAEIGLSSAFMYAEKGLPAITAVLVLNVPKSIVISFIAVLAVREVWRNSSAVLSFLISEERIGENIDLKLYCIKFIVLLVIVFLVSVADSVMNYIFSGLL